MLKRALTCLFAAVALLGSVSLADADGFFPQVNLPPGTVLGRLPGTAGPGEAIPFASIFASGIIGNNTTPTLDGAIADFQNDPNTTAFSIYGYPKLTPLGYDFFETVRSVINLNNAATVQGGAAYGAYGINNAVQGVGPNSKNLVGYFSVVADGVNGAASWGGNFSCGDAAVNGVATLSGRICVGQELDFTANGASIFAGLTLEMQGPGTPSNANGIQIDVIPGSVAKWTYGYIVNDGAALTGMLIGALSPSGSNILSQPLLFNYFNSGGTESSMKVEATDDELLLFSLEQPDGIGFGTGSGNVNIQAVGSDANVNLELFAKGTALILAESPLEVVGLSTQGAVCNSAAGLLSTSTGNCPGDTPVVAGSALTGSSLASGITSSSLTGFGAAGSFATSLQTPLLIGGASVSQALNIESTSGIGTSDVINFKTGSQVTALSIATNQLISLPAVATGTPAASLCIDASNHIIKKTTTGSCV